jgi:hypothetical protein
MSTKGLELLHVFFIGINTRERMNVSMISGVVVWQLVHDFLEILNWVWNVFCLEKSTYCFVGIPEVFGTKGMLEVMMFGLANSTLNFCPIFEIEPC